MLSKQAQQAMFAKSCLVLLDLSCWRVVPVCAVLLDDREPSVFSCHGQDPALVFYHMVLLKKNKEAHIYTQMYP